MNIKNQINWNCRIKSLFRLPVFPIWFGPLLLFAPVLFTGLVIYWGTPLLQFVPWRFYGLQQLKQGVLPLWNPLLGMGAPLAANYQSAFFYPPNWIQFILGWVGGLTALAWSQALVIVLHLVWSGLGMVRLVKKLGLGILAQSVAGIAFSLSGYLVARAGFLSINSAVSWFPWIVLYASQATGYPKRFAVLGQSFSKRTTPFVLCIGMLLLSGHAQTSWYILLFAGVWVAYWSIVEDRWYGLWNAVKRAIIPFCLGIMLASIQLLPTLEYLLQSQRSAAVEYETAMTYSYWPWRLITLFAPGFFGSPASGNYWGYANYWEDADYIGLIPFLMALIVIFKRGNKKIQIDPTYESAFFLRLRQFFIFTIPTIFVIALGKNTPIFPWLYYHIPTFNLFQAPTRWMIWVVFGLIILASMGIEDWYRPIGRRLDHLKKWIVVSLAVVLGAGLGLLLVHTVTPSFFSASLIAGVFGFGAGILTYLAPPKGYRFPVNSWNWLVTGVVLLDLLIADWGLNPGIDQQLYRYTPNLQNEIATNGLTQGRIYLSNPDEYILKFNGFLSFKTFALTGSWQNLRNVVLPNLGLLTDVSSVNNFDPLISSRYARWMDTIGKLDTEHVIPLLQMMGVTVWEKVENTVPVTVDFLPIARSERYYWANCAVVVSDANDVLNTTIRAAQSVPGLIAAKKVVLEGNVQPGDCSQVTEAIIQLKTEKANKLDFTVTASTDGWFVLADQYYPGWKAFIDGEPVPIERANYLFRAVRVSSGEHVISMLYRPVSFTIGLTISGAALLILLVITLSDKKVLD